MLYGFLKALLHVMDQLKDRSLLAFITRSLQHYTRLMVPFPKVHWRLVSLICLLYLPDVPFLKVHRRLPRRVYLLYLLAVKPLEVLR